MRHRPHDDDINRGFGSALFRAEQFSGQNRIICENWIEAVLGERRSSARSSERGILRRIANRSREVTSTARDGWRSSQRAIDDAVPLAPSFSDDTRMDGIPIPCVPPRSVGGGSQAFLPITMQFVMPCALAVEQIAVVRMAVTAAAMLIVDLVICLLPK